MEKFSKEYQIRTYECDKNGHLRLLTLLNILQDMADSHASQLGLGLEFCLKHGLAWVGADYHLKIKRLPLLHEKIKVVTWPSEERLLGAVRDFSVLDEKGNELAAVSSLWVLIDFARKRPVKLRDHLPAYNILAEHSLNSDFAKLPSPVREDICKNFAVRFDDIDLNDHVNNAVYLLWASEAVDLEFRKTHFPCEIEISFKKEGLPGDEIKVITQMENQTSIHSIMAQNNGRELARLRINWQKA